MTGLTKVSEIYGNNNYVAFEDGNQERYLAERIESYGLIQFGAMNGNDIKSVDLSTLTSPISLKSVYAFSGVTTADEIFFEIYRPGSSGNLERVAAQKFTNNQMPYQFPDGAILFPDAVIQVRPRYPVDNVIIYAKPVDILFSLNAA